MSISTTQTTLLVKLFDFQVFKATLDEAWSKLV